ncbi:S41 family peptidase [Vallitalea guaymasensis]|uniref:Tail specific protease domain-containing protein n=1 Tax=Vallitalea guaymasensis TaxID=1185412 RepID=A0A8J8MBP2_9FIRM|nr:S41 family peptidase [Vallitalea guaymasensis]QUH29952.1 hypothetical protein HYG85_13945 [Vallitalea guaymasensis]
MRNKIFIITMFLLMVSQIKVNAQGSNWPIKDKAFGENVLYGPEDKVYNKYLKKEEKFLQYAIAGDENSEIIAVESGVVEYVKPVFNPNFYTCYEYDSHEEGMKIMKKHNIDTKFLTMGICINIGSGVKVYYSGIEPGTEKIKKGDKIQVGDLLGKMGHSSKEIEKYSLIISYESKNKLITPMMNNKGNKVINISKEKDYRNHKISIEDQQKAFKIFKDSLYEGHPALTAYVDRDTLEKSFDKVESKLVKLMTANEFFVILNDIIHLISDNHTYINKTYLTDDTKLYNKPYDFPVQLGVVDGKCYILKEYIDIDNLHVGDQVTAINDRSIDKIINDLKKATGKGDGLIQTFSERYLLTESKVYGSGFETLYDIVYMPNAGEHLDMTLAKGKKIKWVLKKENIVKNTGKRKWIPWESKMLRNNILYLRINGMSLDDGVLSDIEKLLLTTEAQNLILDIRKNPGGEAKNIQRLFSLFAKEEFSVDKRFEVKSNGKYDFFKYTENMIPDSSKFPQYIYDKDKDCYYLDGETSNDGFKTYKPNAEGIYKGNVYVLTSEFTGSAASSFASLFHEKRRGTIIGKEGAGGYHMMCGLEFAYVVLPNTGLQLRIPLVKTISSNQAKDIPYGRGVIPDISVSTSIEDILSEEDIFLKNVVSYVKDRELHGNIVSKWAVSEIKESVSKNLIILKLFNNLRDYITREEFCHMIMDLYDKIDRKPITQIFNKINFIN